MSFSRHYNSPKRVPKSNSKAIFSENTTTLRDGVLLNCARKRVNSNISSGKDLKNIDGLKESTTSTPSPSTSFKAKSPSVNACYTPSSLFRSGTATSTPISGKIARRCNQSLTNSNIRITDDEDRLTVAVRIRPFNAKECLLPTVCNIIRVDKNEVTVLVGATADASAGVTHSFVYDQVFSSRDPESPDYADQKEVFLKTAHPLIGRAFEGYNACLFAYGQTGSGKSYSMMGIDTIDGIDVQSSFVNASELNTDAGIIPRFCHEIFRHIKQGNALFQAEVEVSYFEIYNEKIHDLLCVASDMESSISGRQVGGTPIKTRKALKVREHPIWGPYIVDLSVHPVDSFEALRNWLIVGNSQRATAATGLNDKSSRSHSIFNIMLKINNIEVSDCQGINTLQQARRSKISLVDLAGSERMSGCNGERIREGVHINKSLLTLGKVISALSESRSSNNTSIFVPYRESVLTWLLRVSNRNSYICIKLFTRLTVVGLID